jgi:hypothetical protein
MKIKRKYWNMIQDGLAYGCRLRYNLHLEAYVMSYDAAENEDNCLFPYYWEVRFNDDFFVFAFEYNGITEFCGPNIKGENDLFGVCFNEASLCLNLAIKDIGNDLIKDLGF